MTGIPVVTAVTDARWEADLVAALQRGDAGVTVVRRCVDLADLLATAATGTARAALVSADLRRLDRDALSRLARDGVAVVGLVPGGDEAAERRLRQLGVAVLVAVDAPPSDVASAVARATSASGVSPAAAEPVDPPTATGPGMTPPGGDLGDRAERGGPPVHELDAPELDASEPDGPVPVLPTAGRVVAVWGPTGAPGRTTVAVGLATELAELGVPVLLVDADVYGGVVAPALGLLDETPGLAAACRQANAGALDLPALARHAREVAPGLRVLTGIGRADRWVELRPASLEVVLTLARGLAAVTVVDCGFCLEQDEELSYDTAAPRRNGATLTALAEADEVIVVGSADPVGLQRLVRGLSELREAVPGVNPRVVVNRIRRGAAAGAPEREIRAALARYAGVDGVHPVPLDVAACDGAVASGRSLAEAAPQSAVRMALQALASELTAPVQTRQRRRGLALGLRRRRRAG